MRGASVCGALTSPMFCSSCVDMLFSASATVTSSIDTSEVGGARRDMRGANGRFQEVQIWTRRDVEHARVVGLTAYVLRPAVAVWTDVVVGVQVVSAVGREMERGASANARGCQDVRGEMCERVCSGRDDAAAAVCGGRSVVDRCVRSTLGEVPKGSTVSEWAGQGATRGD